MNQRVSSSKIRRDSRSIGRDGVGCCAAAMCYGFAGPSDQMTRLGPVMRVLLSLLFFPSVMDALLLLSSSRAPWCRLVTALPRYPPSSAVLFTTLILKESLSSEEQEHNMIQKKKKKRKKGFVINPDLPNVVSSNDVIAHNEKQRPTGRLGIPSEDDHESPSRRGRQQKRGRNNNSRRRHDSPIPPPPQQQPGQPGRGCYRNLINIGAEVFVIMKEHQRTGTETQGSVQRHLTKSPYHPRGIKVMLTSGQFGMICSDAIFDYLSENTIRRLAPSKHVAPALRLPTSGGSRSVASLHTGVYSLHGIRDDVNEHMPLLLMK